MKNNVIWINNFSDHRSNHEQKTTPRCSDESDIAKIFLFSMIERLMAMGHTFFILHHFSNHDALFWNTQIQAGIKIGCDQLLAGKGFTLGKPLLIITVAELSKLFELFEFHEVAVSFFHYGRAGIDRVTYSHSRRKEWRLTVYLQIY